MSRRVEVQDLRPEDFVSLDDTGYGDEVVDRVVDLGMDLAVWFAGWSKPFVVPRGTKFKVVNR